MVNPARARSAEAIRPTAACIDLGALAHNLRVLRKAVPQAEIFGVVKADAYGHGAVEVGRRLEREGVDGLCVALPEEGIELRQAGVRLPVLVLGGVFAGGAAETLAYGLTPVVSDIDQVARLQEASSGKPVRVHVKVDTGMSRLGVTVQALPQFLWRLRRYPAIQVEGVMSHLASAEQDEAATRDQQRRFEEALEIVRKAGIVPRTVHLANSAGLFRFPESHYRLVRPGLALYGVSPFAGVGQDLQPVMSVRTQVVFLRDLKPGDAVSYGGQFVAARPTRLAVLPVGYADGMSPHLSGRGQVLVRGCRAPVVGAVCMDMCMVDVTDVLGVSVGDEVVLLGQQGSEEISASELARHHGSVPHEVLTAVSRRVPRFYSR